MDPEGCGTDGYRWKAKRSVISCSAMTGDKIGAEGRMGKLVTVPISVVINTLNEETSIADCVRSVRGLADEIVVADMQSTDRTVETARGLGARVVPVEAQYGDFGRLRYLAVTQARYDWIL